MQKVVLLLLAFVAMSGLRAQLIITDPAAPTDDQAVTITFDATEGTGGLADCNCDVYLHTGVITNNSSGPSDWQYVQTQWGVANADWQLTPVDGEDNKYTYTFGPSIRDYFGVPAGEEIQQIAFVFRNGNGSLEGKGAGGTDIYVDVTAGGELGLTVAGNPGTETWPLGLPFTVLAGATTQADIRIFDNETLVAETTGTELETEIVLMTCEEHVIRVEAEAGGQTVTESFTLEGEFVVNITSEKPLIVFDGEGSYDLTATSYITSQLRINNNAPVTASEISSFFIFPEPGVSTLTVTGEFDGKVATDKVTIVTGPAETADAPDVRPGATDTDDGDVQLLLRAPGKEDVFVIGNFNDWTPDADSRMQRSPDGGTFHLLLENLPAGEDLLYQYFIDGEIVQPDPYSTLILDPNSDRFIEEETFADIPTYPASTEGIVTWHRRSRPAFNWMNDGYDRPDPEKMVVYELLLRDFIADHSFKTLTDSLDYLARLGVNAIELMPVSEFENNDSWGYNVSYHMALDKYYGSPEDFKTFVDACHERGLAVILDVVYNHAFGQSSLARMWWDDVAFRPTPDNPYLNVTARHPFNVGYDFNHESELTKEYVKVTTAYWIEEFHIDGYRFDLSKGFTQRFSDNVGAWNQYDASRVAIIKDYADNLWNVDDDFYMIMEHLAEPTEERELADYGNGMYFWSGFNPHDQYLEASMGYSSNLSSVIAQNRGFADKNLVAYMESHDEERMQYKNEQFGNIAAGYNIQDPEIGFDRVMLASSFFYSVPGPKMLWQFGELAYDFPINYCTNGTVNEGCRTGRKPIRWDYREVSGRQDVYNWIADLNFLRNNYDFFHGDIDLAQLGTSRKLLHLSGTDGRAVVAGNFGVANQQMLGVFPETGTWYDYETGEAIEVTNVGAGIIYGPGEYHVYLDQPISRSGDNNIGTATNNAAVARLRLDVAPNPAADRVRVDFRLEQGQNVRVEVLDVNGRSLRVLFDGRRSAGAQSVEGSVAGLAGGVYFVRVTDGIGAGLRRLVVR